MDLSGLASLKTEEEMRGVGGVEGLTGGMVNVLEQGLPVSVENMRLMSTCLTFQHPRQRLTLCQSNYRVAESLCVAHFCD